MKVDASCSFFSPISSVNLKYYIFEITISNCINWITNFQFRVSGSFLQYFVYSSESTQTTRWFWIWLKKGLIVNVKRKKSSSSLCWRHSPDFPFSLHLSSVFDSEARLNDNYFSKKWNTGKPIIKCMLTYRIQHKPDTNSLPDAHKSLVQNRLRTPFPSIHLKNWKCSLNYVILSKYSMK